MHLCCCGCGFGLVITYILGATLLQGSLQVHCVRVQGMGSTAWRSPSPLPGLVPTCLRLDELTLRFVLVALAVVLAPSPGSSLDWYVWCVEGLFVPGFSLTLGLVWRFPVGVASPLMPSCTSAAPHLLGPAGPVRPCRPLFFLDFDFLQVCLFLHLSFMNLLLLQLLPFLALQTVVLVCSLCSSTPGSSSTSQ